MISLLDLKLKLADRLKALRKAKKLTQDEVAFWADISIGLLSKYENGKSNPNANEVARLAFVLESSSDFLLGLTDDNNTPIADTIKECGFSFKRLNALGVIKGKTEVVDYFEYVYYTGKPTAFAVACIADEFDCTTDFLLGLAEYTLVSAKSYTLEEQVLIGNYRKLSRNRQNLIRNSVIAMLPKAEESKLQKKSK